MQALWWFGQKDTDAGSVVHGSVSRAGANKKRGPELGTAFIACLRAPQLVQLPA